MYNEQEEEICLNTGKQEGYDMNQNDQKTINAIRVLSAEAIQKANSGHPGLPLGAGAGGVYAMAVSDEAESRQSGLERQGSFRAVCRTWIHAAVQLTASVWIWFDNRRFEGVSSVGNADALAIRK